ncbi:MAG: hypothetical protein H0T76_11545 [Nannocystis sp.]|nr:hypothetical protein [Nannocystis sp.]
MPDVPRLCGALAAAAKLLVALERADEAATHIARAESLCMRDEPRREEHAASLFVLARLLGERPDRTLAIRAATLARLYFTAPGNRWGLPAIDALLAELHAPPEDPRGAG